jgi:hypothetical protein
MCEQKFEPPFDPDHPEEYMKHRHSSEGWPKPILYPKRGEEGGMGKKVGAKKQKA